MMLADMGADVIKIEDPARPDPMRAYPPFVGDRSAGFLAVNRNKRSLALDLRAESGQTAFWDLVRSADLVLESYRPGVLAAIGLDYERARRVNPRIIYVSTTGYGQSGPYAQAAGHDLNYIGYTGLLDATGAVDGGPTPPAGQVADVAGGGYLTALACVTALWSRAQTGEGQHVDVAMLDGALPLMSLQLAHHWAAPDQGARGELLLSGGVACYGVYRCQDGKRVALGALEAKFWRGFCDLAGKPAWIDRQFETGAAGRALIDEVKALFAQKTRAQWLALAADRDVCLTPVLGLAEVADDPHLRARGAIRQVDGVPSVGPPLKFSSFPSIEEDAAAPELGAHTRQILRELGALKNGDVAP